MRNSLAVALGLVLAGPASAECRDMAFEALSFSVCEASADQDLRLFLDDAEGQRYGSFARIDAALTAEGAHLVFAMNAGMYHPDRAPVGLYVEEGERRAGLVTREGPGNFGLLPNGVFCFGNGTLAVIESRRFAEEAPACRFATQSGPMLVIDGALHPRFLPDSDSLNLRNGVGVSADGQTAYFVISDQPVTFHRFARFFRDELGMPNALYFDGRISRLYAPELGRDDWGVPMGPVVGLVAPDG
ncbi:phosphodiester glycosidase family protein [Pararhodobacter aggregans]